MVITVLLDISAIILNGIIAYVLKKQKKTNIVSFWFIFCLSISDVLVGATSLICHFLLLFFSQAFTQSPLPLLLTVLNVFPGFFVNFSGRLILIISIDRCIHMKYLSKYSTIMTQFRARLILLFNISFGILVAVPYFWLSKEASGKLTYGVSIFNATGVTMTYIMYVLTYVFIKRQVGTLESLETSQQFKNDMQDTVKRHQRKLSKEKSFNECTSLESRERTDATRPCCNATNYMVIKGNISLQPQNKLYILPSSSLLTTEILKIENRSITDGADIVNNVAANKNNEKEKEEVESNKSNRQKRTKRNTVKKQEKRRAKPEVEFRKATCLILIALFICYAPALSYELYGRASGNYDEEMAFLLTVLVIMNSSLNAIILIFCNRELKRTIKTMIVSR